MHPSLVLLAAAPILFGQSACRNNELKIDSEGDSAPVVHSAETVETAETADSVPETGGALDNDDDGWTPVEGDCDDDDPDVHPEADELCNDLDDDCDGVVDNDLVETWYVDDDGDGFGDPDQPVETCDPDETLSSDDTDCDDTDPTAFPGADESCNDLDDDCDALVDEEAVDGDWFYLDDDDDGFGDPSSPEWACEGIDNDWDCDDTDYTIPQVVDGASTSVTPDGSEADPWPTIQEGIDAAQQCVLVYSGFYYENLDFYGAGVLVRGVEGPDVTVVDGSGGGTAVVTFNNGEGPDAELTGFTLTGGDGYPDYTEDTSGCDSASVDACITYTWTWCGGGVFIDGATPVLSDLVIQDNVLPVANSWQVEEESDWYYEYSYGGGVCVRDGTVSLDRVDLIGNYADQGGGAWVNEASSVDWTRSWVVGNEATDGAGMLVDGGTLALTNVLSTFNVASGSGGGVMVDGGLLAEINVTHGYESATTGGGLYLSGTMTASLLNTIIVDSKAGEGIHGGGDVTLSALYNNVYGNASGEYTGVDDQTGSNGNISWDPKFVDVTDDGDLDNDDFGLEPTSLSVDGGYPSKAYNDADGTTNDQGAFGGPGGDW